MSVKNLGRKNQEKRSSGLKDRNQINNKCLASKLLGQVLSKILHTTYSKKSYNNKFGVPISLFNIKKRDFFGIFETGMDKKGEIEKLTKLIKPNVGLITNISYCFF